MTSLSDSTLAWLTAVLLIVKNVGYSCATPLPRF
jgi:hypothetical protein